MKSILKWVAGAPPRDLEGTVILVYLGTPQAHEYYHEPVAVKWWGDKGKSTLGAHYISRDDIERYCVIG